jgi:hypothetical protein
MLYDVDIREGTLSLAYMYISLTLGRDDPLSFKIPIHIATVELEGCSNQCRICRPLAK